MDPGDPPGAPRERQKGAPGRSWDLAGAPEALENLSVILEA